MGATVNTTTVTLDETVARAILGHTSYNQKAPVPKFKFTILKGYVNPNILPKYGQFQEWIKNTIQTKDKALIKDSISFLETNLAWYETMNDGTSEDSRTQYRINEGLEQLSKELN
jgi:hypothetical protein